MLAMRPPLSCAARTDYIQTGSAFALRLAGNYGQLQEQIEGEDLLHVVTQPPEVFLLGDTGDSYLSETQIRNQQIQKVNIINQAINRILLAVDGHLTYQDEVYITNVLHKLGIVDEKSFMHQVYRLTEETSQVNRLIHMYEDHSMELFSLMEEYRSQSTSREGDTENRLTQEVLHLHEDVFRRWDVQHIYESLREYGMSLEGGDVITSTTYQMAEQTRLSQQLMLQTLREQTRGEAVPLVYHHENIYEGQEQGAVEISIRNLTNRITSAVLLSLVDNIYQAGYLNVDHRKEQHYRFDEVFYRGGDHVLQRIMSNTAYRQHNYETAFSDDRQIQQYREEYTLIRQMISNGDQSYVQQMYSDANVSFTAADTILVQHTVPEYSKEAWTQLQNNYLQQLYNLEQQNLKRRQESVTRLEQLIQNRSDRYTSHAKTEETLVRQTIAEGDVVTQLREGDRYEQQVTETERQELHHKDEHHTVLADTSYSSTDRSIALTEELTQLLQWSGERAEDVQLWEGASYELQLYVTEQQNLHLQELYAAKLEKLMQLRSETHPTFAEEDLTVLAQEIVEGDATRIREGDTYEHLLYELGQQNIRRQEEYVTKLEKLMQLRSETHPTFTEEDLTILRQDMPVGSAAAQVFASTYYEQQLYELEQKNLRYQAEYLSKLERLTHVYTGAGAAFTEEDLTVLQQELTEAADLSQTDVSYSLEQQIYGLWQQNQRIRQEFVTRLYQQGGSYVETNPEFTQTRMRVLQQEVTGGDDLTQMDVRNSLEQQVYELEQRNIVRQEQYLTNLDQLVQQYSGEEMPVTQERQRAASLAALEQPGQFLEAFEQESARERARQGEFQAQREALLPESTREILSLVRAYLAQPERFADENIISVNNEAMLYYDTHISEAQAINAEQAVLLTERESKVAESQGEPAGDLGTDSKAFARLVYAPVENFGDMQNLPPQLWSRLMELRMVPGEQILEQTREAERQQVRIIQRLLSKDPTILNSERRETVYEALSLAHRTESTVMDEETIETLRSQLERMERTTEAARSEVENRFEEMDRTIRNTTQQTITTENQSEITQRVGQTTRVQIDELADKVYSRLERQLNNERMRRGLR